MKYVIDNQPTNKFSLGVDKDGDFLVFVNGEPVFLMSYPSSPDEGDDRKIGSCLYGEWEDNYGFVITNSKLTEED